eukprot:m.254915 g.254915  ORF g.254915 m.254915 type:complete len:1497 (+) comp19152_c2_seq1:1648-6138(+)
MASHTDVLARLRQLQQEINESGDIEEQEGSDRKTPSPPLASQPPAVSPRHTTPAPAAAPQHAIPPHTTTSPAVSPHPSSQEASLKATRSRCVANKRPRSAADGDDPDRTVTVTRLATKRIRAVDDDATRTAVVNTNGHSVLPHSVLPSSVSPPLQATARQTAAGSKRGRDANPSPSHDDAGRCSSDSANNPVSSGFVGGRLDQTNGAAFYEEATASKRSRLQLTHASLGQTIGDGVATKHPKHARHTKPHETQGGDSRDASRTNATTSETPTSQRTSAKEKTGTTTMGVTPRRMAGSAAAPAVRDASDEDGCANAKQHAHGEGEGGACAADAAAAPAHSNAMPNRKEQIRPTPSINTDSATGNATEGTTAATKAAQAQKFSVSKTSELFHKAFAWHGTLRQYLVSKVGVDVKVLDAIPTALLDKVTIGDVTAATNSLPAAGPCACTWESLLDQVLHRLFAQPAPTTSTKPTKSTKEQTTAKLSKGATATASATTTARVTDTTATAPADSAAPTTTMAPTITTAAATFARRNVLVRGFNERRVQGSSRFVAVFPNTLLTSLKHQAWVSLHQAVGDEVMMYLLGHTSVFHKTDAGNCLVQLAGPPFHDLVVTSKRNRNATLTGGAQNIDINRVPMFYATDLRERFPKKHLLAQKPPPSGNRLARHVFGLSSRERLPPRIKQTLPLFQQLARRFRDTGRSRLLQLCCPMDAFPAQRPGDDHGVHGHASANAAQQPTLVPDVDGPSELDLDDGHGLVSQPLDSPPAEAAAAADAAATKHKALSKRERLGPVAIPYTLGHRQLVTMFTPYRQVVRFLAAVLDNVVPVAMWGSAHNRACIMARLRDFVLLSRTERLTLHYLMQGLRVNDCAWLGQSPARASASDHATRTALLQQWVKWLFEDVVLPLVRSYFYVTESGPHKKRVFYYRKPLWKRLQQLAVHRLIQEGHIHLVPDHQHAEFRAASLGVSFLRLLPKLSGMRNILNMGRQPSNTADPGKSELSINTKLANLFAVLNFEKERDPSIIGATVFGRDDVYARLKPFICSLQAAAPTSMQPPQLAAPVYVVSVDVSNCFDSIKQHKLFEIVKGLLREEEYVVRMYDTVILDNGQPKRVFKRHVAPGGHLEKFQKYADESVAGVVFHDAVLIDRVWSYPESREHLLDLLTRHCFSNAVQIGGRLYRQTTGISQGSVLSTLLCSFFYGHLDKFLPAAKTKEALLMRQTDDFLLVTTSLRVAETFSATMHSGIEEYGCAVNIGKSTSNFTARGRVTSHVRQGARAAPPKGPEGTTLLSESPASAVSDTDVWFPWSGLLLNWRTLEVRCNYDVYEGTYLVERLQVEVCRKPGEALRQKLLFCMREKAHPLLLDPEINGQLNIAVNVFQALCWGALLFHCSVRALPAGRRSTDNPTFFFDVIQAVISYFHAICCLRLKKVGLKHVLSEIGTTFLGLHAFDALLTRKQTTHKALLPLLESAKATASGQLHKKQRTLLKAAMGASNVGKFRQFLY